MRFKIILLLFLFSKSVLAFCPACVCTEFSSALGERTLIEAQREALLKDIVPNLTEMAKEAKRLKKAEEEQLRLIKKLTAIEYYKSLKLKHLLHDLRKQKSLLFLKIKEIQNQTHAENLENKFILYKQK